MKKNTQKRDGGKAPAKKIWREKKPDKPKGKPQTAARSIAKLEGQRGIDSRAQDAGQEMVKEMVVKTSDVSIDVACAWNPNTIESLSMGIVLTAIRRGWLAQLDQATLGYPYFAYVRMYQSFIGAMTSAEIDIQNAPVWYWHVVQALNPKIVPYKTGSVNLTWVIPPGAAGVVPPILKSYLAGSVSFGYIDPTPPTVDGFYRVVPIAYNAAAGDTALKSLFSFFKDEGFTHLTPYIDTGMSKNASAFAVCGEEFGVAAGSTGGIVTTLYSETPIHSPILSKFATYQLPPYFRGWDRVQRSGGSACYTIPRMTEFKSEKELYNQIPPQFKFVNFDEIFEVLSLTVAVALELQSKQPLGATAPIPCPLSSQQVQMLLRHTLIQKFDNHLAQDLQLTGSGLIGLFPLSTGVNGAAFTPTNMLLPLLLAENIRSLSRKKIKLSKGRGNSVLDVIPVLARPNSSEGLNQLGNYVWTDNAGTTTTVYTVLAGETPINILDLSYDTGAGVLGYVTTEGEQIAIMCATWNEWIKGLSSYLTPLTDVGAEKGLNAFGASLVTLQQKYEDVSALFANAANRENVSRLKKQVSKKNIGLEPMTRRKLGAAPDPASTYDYFQSIIPTEITATNTFLEVTAKYLRVMILPACVADRENFNSSTLGARQVFQIEPYRLPLTGIGIQTLAFSSEVPGATAYTRHYLMAVMDTKSPLAAKSEVEMDLEIVAAQGRGGFFSNLAGMFAEDVLGIQGGRQIAGAIGNAIGI